MSSLSSELPRVTHARFLNIGTKTIVAGNVYGLNGYSDGQTFYSEEVEEIDGNVARTKSLSFRFSRGFN